MAKFFEYEIKGGKPLKFGENTITPFAKSLVIRIPGLPGGLVWNKPESVLVVNAQGGEEVIPVQNVTRRIEWALIGASIISTLAMWLLFRKRRGK
ncbi:MAG: hypothetical protein P8074_08735 [Anaerolineales bacterium]|jgi:hypothetical protein